MSPLNITQPLDSIRYMVYNGYDKVMSNIPKIGHLTTPVLTAIISYANIHADAAVRARVGGSESGRPTRTSGTRGVKKSWKEMMTSR